MALPLPGLAGASERVPDPVFAAIERYKVLSAEHTVAVDRWAPLEDDDPDLLEAEDETERTSTSLFEQMDLIFSFRPSTVAGVAALLKYISTLKDWQMPQGLDDSDSMKAVKTLCTCLAAAIEQSGGAVMSNIIELPTRTASRPAADLPAGNGAEIKKLPYNVTRGAHSRKPRRSKNGTPQERAAKISAVAEAAANITQLSRPASSMLEEEFAAKIARLDESGRQYITGYMQALLDQRGMQ